MDGTAGVSERAIIKIAIMAVGGQGGGVLTNWIVDLAEASGWHAQSTAVAGVAQRTGATFYYIEMAPDLGRTPVFSLAPAPGDVDVVIAAEWMEAGRAVMRGFVTPDRTTVIASTHRMLAVSEKIVPGDGVADGEPVAEALEGAAARVIAFDMMRAALASGSVVSATLFGALAHSGILPFAQTAFEDTIKRGGRGAEASLAAFRAGVEHQPDTVEATPLRSETPFLVPDAMASDWDRLCARVQTLPKPIRAMADAGLRKVVDFQDVAYGDEYLDLLRPFVDLSRGPEHALGCAAAKHIANAMAYDDVIRVADLKTRGSRFDRIDRQMDRKGRPMHITEFMHPRAEEVCGLLPAHVGRWIEARPRLMRWFDRRINRGRRIRSNRVRGFLMLYLIAGLRDRRRGTLRHAVEHSHWTAWLDQARAVLPQDPALAVEVLKCRRLIKGYSDTHGRGQSKFDRVLSALPALIGRGDAADWLRRLCDAALQDEEGAALDGALKTVESFTGSSQPEREHAADSRSPPRS